MTDVDIRPRYVDPNIHRVIDQPAQMQQQAVNGQIGTGVNNVGTTGVNSVTPQDISKGWFTNMYENKLIIMFIVLSIILIAFVAYFVLRKPDENPVDKPKKTKNGGDTGQAGTPTQPVGTNLAQHTQHTQQPMQQTTQVQTNQVQTNQVQTTPAQQPMQQATQTQQPKKNLGNLLERSRNVTVDKKPAAATVITGSKTEEEIMQLMESDQEEDVDEELDEELDELDEEEPPKPAPDLQCTTTLKSGQRCKLKVRNNGKCTKHGG